MEPSRTKELKDIHDLKKEEFNHVESVYESVNKKLREVSKISIRKLITEF